MHERMMDRTHQPTDTEMMEWIGHPLSAGWDHLRRFLAHTYAVEPIMNAGGKRYGWNVQYRIGGRPLCEMYPEHGSFTALVILGRAELEKAMQGIESYGENVQRALRVTPRYHDGCWMYIRVSDPELYPQEVQDIGQLILLKRKPAARRPVSS